VLVARAGDGSMRDAQSALDQVIAFAGDRITAEDVATVLGLVRRDLLMDIAEAVAAEDAAPPSPSPARRSRPATTCGWSSASWRA
jgi:DNA polymerase III gamma/tau subunit